MPLEILRRSSPRNAALLVVNIGPGAVELPRSDGYDVAELYFHPTQRARAEQSSAEFVVFDPDPSIRKMGLVSRTFQAMAGELGHYDRIMLADDDLYPVRCTVAQTFALFDELVRDAHVRVAQPALTGDSFYSHPVTLDDGRYRWRRTNFVEMMIPLFTREALVDYLPAFGETPCDGGLDALWSALEMDTGRPLAILDATPWRHTRPVLGGHIAAGLTPEAIGKASADFKARHGVVDRPALTLGGVSVEDDSWISHVFCHPPAETRIPDCGERADFSFGWINRAQRTICARHVPLLGAAAHNMAIPVRLVGLSDHERDAHADPRGASSC